MIGVASIFLTIVHQKDCNRSMTYSLKLYISNTNLDILKWVEVITGEGKIDRQTIYGKTPIGVARTAKKYGIPVIAFAGNIGSDSHVVYDNGVDSLMSIISYPMTLDIAMERSQEFLADSAERVFRLIKLGRRIG